MEAKRELRMEGVLKSLQTDPTKVDFLQDLIAYKQEYEHRGDQKSPTNIIQLVKTKLAGKYGDDVRKCIHDRDFAALKRILTPDFNPDQESYSARANVSSPQDKSGLQDGESRIQNFRTEKLTDQDEVIMRLVRLAAKAGYQESNVKDRRDEKPKHVAATVLKRMIYELLKQNLQICYERILNLTQLSNTNFDGLRFPNNPQDEKRNFQLSIQIKLFKNNMMALFELTQEDEQQFQKVEENPKRFLRMKRFWIQEMLHLRAINQLIREFSALKTDWGRRESDLSSEIKRLQSAVQSAARDNIYAVREEVKIAEITRLIKGKLDEKRQAQNSLDSTLTMSNRIDVMLNLCEKEEELRCRKTGLENDLQRTIAKFDSTMIISQKKLDVLDLEIEATYIFLETLKIKFDEIEVRYDDMTRTKKLKELLKSIEMADGFKKNRAARIIQAVWRRYKMMKQKKLKRKSKLRRNKSKKDVGDKGKDSSSEAGRGSTRSGSVVPVRAGKNTTPSSAVTTAISVSKSKPKPSIKKSK